MRHRLIAPLGLVTALVVGGPALAQTADAAVDQASDASATVQDADSRAYLRDALLAGVPMFVLPMCWYRLRALRRKALAAHAAH